MSWRRRARVSAEAAARTCSLRLRRLALLTLERHDDIVLAFGQELEGREPALWGKRLRGMREARLRQQGQRGAGGGRTVAYEIRTSDPSSLTISTMLEPFFSSTSCAPASTAALGTAASGLLAHAHTAPLCRALC